MPRDPRRSFTGRTVRRKPRKRVLLFDDLARWLITATGIGSIVAVSLVGLFLVWVVLPLLAPTSIGATTRLQAPGDGGVSPGRPAAGIVKQTVDDYGSMVWSLMDDGTFDVRGLAPGQLLPRVSVADSLVPTAWAFAGEEGRAAFGFADGTVMTVAVNFAVDFPDDDEVPVKYDNLQPEETATWDGALLTRTPEGQFRRQVFSLERDDPMVLGEAPVVLVDIVRTSAGVVLVAVDAAGVIHDRTLSWKTNMLTGRRRLRSREAHWDLTSIGAAPVDGFVRMMVDDTGDLVLLVEAGGRTVLLRRDDTGAFSLAGVQDLAPQSGARITALEFLAGRVSVAVGDELGGLTVWFPVPGPDGRVGLLQPVHRLQDGPAAVTSLGASRRSRILAAGYRDGSVRLYHVTSHRLLGEGRQVGGSVDRLTIAPREDLLLVTNVEGSGLWEVVVPHPETSWGTLMRPVWYESYPAPSYVWQSSAAEDTFEPKLSLVPLIYGTLKATFYSLLFGLPLALMAAMYTSEFLHKSVRARVKPVIEIMASLPSVVLGFLAALVMAPLVEDVAVEVLTVMVGTPFCVLLGAHLWQLLPREVGTRFENLRLVAVLAVLVVGAVASWQTGPLVERMVFAGDFKAWLDGRVGSGVAGWSLLLLPLSAVLVGWANVRWGEGLLRSRGRNWTLTRLGLLDLGRFLLSAVAAVMVTLVLSWLISGLGWDPRGSVFDTYVQRNALVVGIAMGFAVIPIIYTISEDALTAVPDHLRAASLGAGATPWQTMVLVIVPPAMSGLFSAVMIGLGRAVGETMIVLMAAGNTPVMDMNIFNGFRTLSANLAVELPEAVQNSTHYRTLFLAALSLFAMTFILNTVAEVVRLRFRGKTSRL